MMEEMPVQRAVNCDYRKSDRIGKKTAKKNVQVFALLLVAMHEEINDDWPAQYEA